MNHSCEHHHPAAHGRSLRQALIIAVIFMVVEVVGGYLANSLALLTDAMHMFTDVGALMVGLLVFRIARRPSTPMMSYGFHRAEILGALGSALSLWGLCAVLIYEAIKRLFAPQPVEGPLMFVVAGAGLLANIWMIVLLHGSQQHSLNLRAAYLHVLSDLLGSLGVLIGGALLWFTKWNPIDPIVTLIFSLTILYGSWKVVKEAVCVLMESTPESINPEAIEAELLKIPGVKEVHDLHVWSVSSRKTALSCHLITNNPQALGEAHRLIEKNFGIRHMTIQIEDPAAFESNFCYDCTNNNNSH